MLGIPEMHYMCLNHSPDMLLLNLFSLVHVCEEAYMHCCSLPDKFSSLFEEKETRTLFILLLLFFPLSDLNQLVGQKILEK